MSGEELPAGIATESALIRRVLLDLVDSGDAVSRAAIRGRLRLYLHNPADVEPLTERVVAFLKRALRGQAL